MSKKRLLTVMGGSKKPAWYLAGGLTESDIIAAYQPVSAVDKETGMLNLVNPATHVLTESGTVPWTTELGWQAGSPNYFITDIKPSLTLSIVIKTSGSPAGYQVGCVYSSKGIILSTELYRKGGTLSTAGMASGDHGIAGQKAYKNGVSVGDIPAGDIGTSGNYNMFILCVNLDGTANLFQTTGYIQAIAFYNKDISAAMPSIHQRLAMLPPFDLAPVWTGAFTYSSTIGV